MMYTTQHYTEMLFLLIWILLAERSGKHAIGAWEQVKALPRK